MFIALFGRGRDAGVALVPALMCALASLLPGYYLFERWFPEKPHPSESPMSTASMLVWCRTEQQHVNLSSNAYKLVEKFVGRETIVRYPKQEGTYEVQVDCPTCQMHLKKSVVVRGVRAQKLEAGCWCFGCLFPVAFVILTLSLGTYLQNKFGLAHIICATIVTFAISGVLFTFLRRNIHKNGLAVQFQDLALSRASVSQHCWSELSVGNEPN